MAIKISTTYSGRTDNTDPNYPYGKGRNVVGGVEGTGTPFEADWYNNLEGFLQGLLLEADITPDGNVDNANSSQLVEAVRGLGKSADKISTKTDESVQNFIDTFALKIFQSPTDDGLTEIQTRTVDASELYEVRKISDDSLATIYSDSAGTVEIVQNGSDNVSGGDGVVEFYIVDGDYYIDIGSNRSNFYVSSKGTLLLSSLGELPHDATAALQHLASISAGKDVVFDYDLDCEITDEVNFKNPKSIDFGNLKISFDAVNTIKPITVGDETNLLLHTAESSINSGEQTITLPLSSGLEEGDVISIWNPADYSFSGFRPSYRQGEYSQVARIDGNSVILTRAIEDDYPIGTKIYKLNANKINLTGSIKCTNVGVPALSYGLIQYQIVGGVFDGLSVTLINGTHALQPTRCLNCSGTSMSVKQISETVIGGDYGNIFAACQNINFAGVFYANRHGCAFGNTNQDAEAINRDCFVSGEILTSGLGLVQAAECHGNTVRCGYGGYIEGFIGAGDRSYVTEGSIIRSAYSGSVPVQYAEMKSTRHTLNGSIVGFGDDPVRGLINVDGGFNENTTIGGVLDFSNLDIAGDTTGNIVRLRNRGATVDYMLDLMGINSSVENSTSPYLVSTVSGTNPTQITFNNEEWTKGVICPSSVNISGMIQKGSYTIVLDTNTNTMSKTVVYEHPFPASHQPHVSVSDSVGIVGSSIVQTYPSSPVASGFTAQTYTLDRVNFSSGISVVVTWRAEA